MKVKDLITLFSADTNYSIIAAENPRLVWWWGRGNNVNTTVNDEEIKAIQNTKKQIIIYV